MVSHSVREKTAQLGATLLGQAIPQVGEREFSISSLLRLEIHSLTGLTALSLQAYAIKFLTADLHLLQRLPAAPRISPECQSSQRHD